MLQSEKGKQALNQIGAQGQVETALQGMKGDQAEIQINTQGNVDKQLQNIKERDLSSRLLSYLVNRVIGFFLGGTVGKERKG